MRSARLAAYNFFLRGASITNATNFTNVNNNGNVNTNGNANNNNSRNSNGLAPDFVSQQWYWSTAVARIRVKYDLYERRNASCDSVRNCPLIFWHERRRETERAWRVMYLTPFHVQELCKLDDTLQDTCTEDE